MNIYKRVAAGLLAGIVLLGTAGAAEAGIIPWLYNAIFGPVRQPYYGAYYGAYYAPAPVPAMPAPCGPVGCPVPPAVSMGYAPCPVPAFPPQVAMAPPAWGMCGPVAPCPCDVGCPTGTGCPTGGCPSPISPQPSATPSPGAGGAAEVPRTFQEQSKPVPSPQQEPADEGFRAREQGGPGAEAIPSEAFKPTETVIPKKTPAPKSEPSEGSRPKKSSEKKESDADRLPVPTLKLDEKVTWYVVPPRRRLPLRASFTAPAVLRTRIDRNAGWTPVPAGAKLVQK